MMSRLFLQVINWIGFVRTTVSQNLKVDGDPAPPFAEEKQNRTFKKPAVALTDTQCVAFPVGGDPRWWLQTPQRLGFSDQEAEQQVGLSISAWVRAPSCFFPVSQLRMPESSSLFLFSLSVEQTP